MNWQLHGMGTNISDTQIRIKSWKTNDTLGDWFLIDFQNPSNKQDFKENPSLLSKTRYGVSTNRKGLLIKYMDEEKDYIHLLFNEEKYSSVEDNLISIKLSRNLSQKLPEEGLQFSREGLEGWYIAPNGIHNKNKLVAKFLPQNQTGNLCFIFQPDIGYFSKQMIITDTNWLPGKLKSPCIIPIESPNLNISPDYPFYLLIWDNVQLNGYPIKNNQNSVGYYRSLFSGEDLLIIQNNQRKDDYFFIIFERDGLKPLPEDTEGIVINHEGVILGVGVQKEVIFKKRYDLVKDIDREDCIDREDR